MLGLCYDDWVNKDILVDYERSQWFGYLDHSMQDLVRVSIEILEREENDPEQVFHDYSFVVFPMAKAYEGFLKKVFLETGLITRVDFESKHFRVGKSLNPDLPKKYRRDDWVYGKLVERLQPEGKGELPDLMWEMWREGRNLLFHYWPEHENFISLEVARKKVEDIVRVIEEVVGTLNVSSSR